MVVNITVDIEFCTVILGAESVPLVEPDTSKKSRGSAQVTEPLNLEHEKYGLPRNSIAQREAFKLDRQNSQKSTQNFGSEAKQASGALPEGFFDNKEDDLRARGIKPVKPDVKYILSISSNFFLGISVCFLFLFFCASIQFFPC